MVNSRLIKNSYYHKEQGAYVFEVAQINEVIELVNEVIQQKNLYELEVIIEIINNLYGELPVLQKISQLLDNEEDITVIELQAFPNIKLSKKRIKYLMTIFMRKPQLYYSMVLLLQPKPLNISKKLMN